MTVKELIAKLQKLSPDSQVIDVTGAAVFDVEMDNGDAVLLFEEEEE